FAGASSRRPARRARPFGVALLRGLDRSALLHRVDLPDREAAPRHLGAGHRADHRLHQEHAGGADLHAPEGLVRHHPAGVRDLARLRRLAAVLYGFRRGHPLPARYPGRSAVRNGAVAAGRAARARIARVSRPWNEGPSRLGLGALAPVFRGDLSEIVPAPAIVGGVSQREASLRFSEIAQDFFARRVPILGQRLEEVDHFRGRLLVLRRRHQLVARCRVLDLLDVPSRAAPRILSDSSRHVGKPTAGAETWPGPPCSWEAGASSAEIRSSSDRFARRSSSRLSRLDRVAEWTTRSPFPPTPPRCVTSAGAASFDSS